MSLLVWLCLSLTLSLYAVSSLSWFGSVYVSLYHSMLSHLSLGLSLSISHSITLCCLISLLVWLCLCLTLSLYAVSSPPWFVSVYISLYHSMLPHLSLGLSLSMSHFIRLCCLISLLVWLCLYLTLSLYAVSSLSWFDSVYISLYHSMLSHLSPDLTLSISHSITLCWLTPTSPFPYTLYQELKARHAHHQYIRAPNTVSKAEHYTLLVHRT